jgi:hypothetical protein
MSAREKDRMTQPGTAWSRKVTLKEVFIVIGVIILTTEISVAKDAFVGPLERDCIHFLSLFLLIASIVSMRRNPSKPTSPSIALLFGSGFILGVLTELRFTRPLEVNSVLMGGVGAGFGGALGGYLGSKIGYWAQRNLKPRKGASA